MILSNASPLIYSAKLGKINLLKILYKKITIPRIVYDEVVTKGKKDGFLDAFIVEKAIKEGWIIVKEIKSDKKIENFAPEIDLGEINLISLAKKLKPSLILIDDASARTIAESFGFNVKGTLYVLFESYRKKLIKKPDLKKLVNKLISLDFRISQELYIQLLDELEKF